jgi:hypothetical protein
VVVTPTLELSERDEDELTARNELDDRLDAAPEGVEAHAEAGGGFLAGDGEARHGLYRATHRTTRAGAGGRSPGRLRGHLGQAGVSERPTVALADAGFWNEQRMDQVTANHGIEVLIPPDSSKRDAPRPGWTGGRYAWMRTVLATELGDQLYRKRKQTIEPIFGHTKHNRDFERFHRRGRSAVRTEGLGRLLLVDCVSTAW